MLQPFQNEPLTDYSKPENIAAFEAAMAKVKNEIGKSYPLVIGDKRIETEDRIESLNPARPSEVLGSFGKGGKDHADMAMDAALKAYDSWKHVSPNDRAKFLLRAAAEMRRRKHEFNAVMVLEVGKSWAEAEADTAEAIDFMEYYARQIMRIGDSSHMLNTYAPEQLNLQYIGLGVVLVIPPWNFPNAIMTGMTTAAIVSGNSVILKPSSVSPWIAWKLCELLWDQGLPPGVLNFFPASGRVAGSYLVEHPKTRMIAFTGSKEVGLDIFEKAAKTSPGQIWLKRTMLEMGGKDAVVVDETADLEAAAQGIVTSAFGFQGQKCSAGSRAIIVGKVYDKVVKRVVELTKKITVGATDIDPTMYMGPVVDEAAFKSIMNYIEIGSKEGKLLHGGHAIETDTNGYFIEPTIFGDVDRDARIAQEEIFGPVLAIIRAKNFDDALAIANGTEYGLTGALFSQNRERLERARREFHVGNLYLNRKCTGAFVGVHPFGGFNMSGTDSKAGGPDYLLLFTQAKSIAERL